MLTSAFNVYVAQYRVQSSFIFDHMHTNRTVIILSYSYLLKTYMPTSVTFYSYILEF